MLIVQFNLTNSCKMDGWMDGRIDGWQSLLLFNIYKNWSWWLLEDSAHSSDVKTSMVRWGIPQIYCRSLLSNFPSTNPLCVEKCATSTEFNSLPPVSNNPVSGLSLTHGSLSNWAIDGSRLFWQSWISFELKLKLQYAALQLSSSGGCEGVGGPATGAP